MDSPADNYWPEPCASCTGTGEYQINLEALSAKPGLSSHNYSRMARRIAQSAAAKLSF